MQAETIPSTAASDLHESDLHESNEAKPRERRQRRTRQAILDAARQLLIERGPSGVSLRAIARQIDYSAAGLYEYFDSKEAIIQEVSREGMDRLAEAMAGANADQPYPDFMLEIGHAYLAFARTNPDHFMLTFTTVPQGNQLEDFMTDSSAFALLITAIERGIDEGFFPLHDGGIAAMAMIFWSSVHGLAMLEQTQLKGSTLDFATIGEAVCINIFLGLTNPAGAEIDPTAATPPVELP